MTMKYSYEDSIKISQQALDLIDIKKFLISGKNISDIEYDILFYIHTSENEEVKNFMLQYSDVFGVDLDIFNHIDNAEFMDYCKKRYPDIYWGNEIIERHWVI